MIFIVTLGACAAVFILLFTVLYASDERREVRQALQRLQGQQIDNLREQELLASLKERSSFR